MMRCRLLVLGALALAGVVGCGDTQSCDELAISRPMTYEATLPAAVDVGATLEVCFDRTCDTSKLGASRNPNVHGILCQDIDGRTPNFPTECTFDQSSRKLTFTTNTVYGGHAGTSPLVVTAIDSTGARTELLRGTVAFTDTSDDTSRRACTTAWQGTFTKS